MCMCVSGVYVCGVCVCVRGVYACMCMLYVCVRARVPPHRQGWNRVQPGSLCSASHDALHRVGVQKGSLVKVS